MKKTLLIAAILLIMSCGARKSNVSKSETEKTVSEQTDKTTAETVKETVTTTIDTNITLLERKSEIEKPVSVILEGEPMIYEDEFVKSETAYDKSTGNIKTTTIQKKRDIPVKKKEVIDREINRDIKEEKTVDISERTKTKDKDTEREGMNLFTYIGMGAVVLFLLWLLIFVMRKAREKKNIV